MEILDVDILHGLLGGVLRVGNSLEQLGDGGRDVRQLDDVTIGGLGRLRRQFVGDRKVSDQAASHGNIPLLNLLTMHIY